MGLPMYRTMKTILLIACISLLVACSEPCKITQGRTSSNRCGRVVQSCMYIEYRNTCIIAESRLINDIRQCESFNKIDVCLDYAINEYESDCVKDKIKENDCIINLND